MIVWRNKLGLGTAQFGLNYGINNSMGKVSAEQALKIVEQARLGGIDTIDTAASYGNSEQVLGDCVVSDFRIVTKISPDARTPSSINLSVRNSLNQIKLKRVYGVLVHNIHNFFSDAGSWAELLALKNDGFISKIGVSVYKPAELIALLDRGLVIDLVQVPYNILDLRFKPLFPLLREAQIEIHVRSIFLQGVFFMNPQSLPSYLLPIVPRLVRLKHISVRLGVPLSTVLLAIGILETTVDRLIIGADSIANLQDNLFAAGLCAACESVFDELQDFALQDEKILLPTNWPVLAS